MGILSAPSHLHPSCCGPRRPLREERRRRTDDEDVRTTEIRSGIAVLGLGDSSSDRPAIDPSTAIVRRLLFLFVCPWFVAPRPGPNCPSARASACAAANPRSAAPTRRPARRPPSP